ncbi:MAG: NUDIX hydrolase [Clostridia bacterium]|nr:NUDIX hydrolase [Clostridia bacterium]
MEAVATDYTKSVTGVVIRDHQVLLARHTYGTGKGLLIVPGGYVNVGEAPEDAVVREYLEETKILVKPKNVIGVRFNMHDWYVAFSADYVSGDATSDHDENSEIVWLDVDEALARDDVPDLTKKLIRSAISASEPLTRRDFEASAKYAPQSLYCL